MMGDWGGESVYVLKNFGMKYICFVGVMMSDVLLIVNEIIYNWN